MRFFKRERPLQSVEPLGSIVVEIKGHNVGDHSVLGVCQETGKLREMRMAKQSEIAEYFKGRGGLSRGNELQFQAAEVSQDRDNIAEMVARGELSQNAKLLVNDVITVGDETLFLTAEQLAPDNTNSLIMTGYARALPDGSVQFIDISQSIVPSDPGEEMGLIRKFENRLGDTDIGAGSGILVNHKLFTDVRTTLLEASGDGVVDTLSRVPSSLDEAQAMVLMAHSLEFDFKELNVLELEGIDAHDMEVLYSLSESLESGLVDASVAPIYNVSVDNTNNFPAGLPSHDDTFVKVHMVATPTKSQFNPIVTMYAAGGSGMEDYASIDEVAGLVAGRAAEVSQGKKLQRDNTVDLSITFQNMTM